MMTWLRTNPSERTKAKATARSRGRTCILKVSTHFGRLAATRTAPHKDVIANQRHGNCTSDSFGITAQSGRVSAVVKRKLVTVKVAAAISPSVLPVLKNNVSAMTGPASRAANIGIWQVCKRIDILQKTK